MSPEEKVFFADEMKIKLCPRMFKECSIPGMRHHVEATCLDDNEKTLFGAVDIKTGELVTSVFDRCRTWEFIQFLDKLLTRYPQKTIYMVCDNYIIHKSREFQRYHASHPRLRMVYQPTYSFYLNCIELLWLYVRKAVCYNNFFAKVGWLTEEILKFLNSLTPARILQAIGIKKMEVT